MEECKGCKFDKIVDNSEEFIEILNNCQSCCRAYIDDSEEQMEFKDMYVR
ncbi:hypothetical protein KQI61_15430 [Anaerocolumna aminovalerica]|nr:hypothetical protein [Anaerocolumna aminovalerica]MBU5333590.1 hypothetical protein [Anaerocolumna aminovalerica]